MEGSTQDVTEDQKSQPLAFLQTVDRTGKEIVINAGKGTQSKTTQTTIIIITAATETTYSQVTCSQPVSRSVFSRCSLILTVVLDLWLHSVSAQAAHPVASEQDKKQHQVNNNTGERMMLNALDKVQVTV